MGIPNPLENSSASSVRGGRLHPALAGQSAPPENHPRLPGGATRVAWSFRSWNSRNRPVTRYTGCSFGGAGGFVKRGESTPAGCSQLASRPSSTGSWRVRVAIKWLTGTTPHVIARDLNGRGPHVSVHQVDPGLPILGTGPVASGHGPISLRYSPFASADHFQLGRSHGAFLPIYDAAGDVGGPTPQTRLEDFYRDIREKLGGSWPVPLSSACENRASRPNPRPERAKSGDLSSACCHGLSLLTWIRHDISHPAGQSAPLQTAPTLPVWLGRKSANPKSRCPRRWGGGMNNRCGGTGRAISLRNWARPARGGS